MDRKRYEEIVRGFAGRRIVVLGDLMMDEYLWGQATRISPESPVMVVEVERETSVPGGAANVVNNLLALGAAVAVVGVVGEDEAGASLLAALRAEGAEVSGIVVDASRPTTRKTRVVAHSQQVLRIDREQTYPIEEGIATALLERLRQEIDGAQAVIISDYNKGVLTPSVARTAVQSARQAGVLLTANPKPANSWTLAGAHLVQMNQSEAEATAALSGIASGVRDKALGDNTQRPTPRMVSKRSHPSQRLSPNAHPPLEVLGAALRRALDVEMLLVTQGAKGLSVWCAEGDVHHVPAHPVEVYDVAGAGDTVISALTLGLAAGAPVEEAAVVANHAAACVIRKVGVATVTPEELLADWEERD